MDPLIGFALLVIIAGFLTYMVERFIPMSEPFVIVLRVVVVVFLVIALCRVLGINLGRYLS